MNYDASPPVTAYGSPQTRGYMVPLIVGGTLVAIGSTAAYILRSRERKRIALQDLENAKATFAVMEKALDEISAGYKPQADPSPESNFNDSTPSMEDRMNAAISKMLRRTNYSERAVALAQASQAYGNMSNSEMLDIIVEASTFE